MFTVNINNISFKKNYEIMNLKLENNYQQALINSVPDDLNFRTNYLNFLCVKEKILDYFRSCSTDRAKSVLSTNSEPGNLYLLLSKNNASFLLMNYLIWIEKNLVCPRSLIWSNATGPAHDSTSKRVYSISSASGNTYSHI